MIVTAMLTSASAGICNLTRSASYGTISTNKLQYNTSLAAKVPKTINDNHLLFTCYLYCFSVSYYTDFIMYTYKCIYGSFMY